VLGGVARLAPARMISVLLPSARVAPGGLEVPLGVGADPHVRPGGRDGEAPDAGEGLAILDGAAARVDVGEAFPCAAAPEARLRVGDVAEARLVRGIRGLGRQRDDGLHARAMRRARRSAFWPVQRWRRPEAIAAPAATGGSIQAATPPPSSAPEIHVRIASAPRAPATRGRTRRETRARATPQSDAAARAAAGEIAPRSPGKGASILQPERRVVARGISTFGRPWAEGARRVQDSPPSG